MSEFVAVPTYSAGPSWDHRHRAVVSFTLAILGAACAGLVVGAPRLLCVLATAAWMLGVAVVVKQWLPSMFLNATGVLLFGYACFSKFFSYLGYPPVFVGELVMALGILAVVLTPARRFVIDTPLAILVVLFGLWGAARTLPFLGEYGLDALRDAVVWGYGGFGLAFAACIRHTGDIAAALRRYGRAIPIFLICAPSAFVIARLGSNIIDQVAWIPLPPFKPGDIAVHLGGSAVFLLLGLHRREGAFAWARWRSAAFFAAWVITALIVSSVNRGAIMSLAGALAIVGLLYPRKVGVRLAMAGSLLIVSVACLLLLTPSKRGLPPEDERRRVSVQQLSENVRNLLGSSSYYGNLDGTREWRLEWWREIVAYTVTGREFLGKGFGINLANDDGFQVHEDESLRSPHSIHMSILARAGVPGLLLWAAVNLAYALAMLNGHFQARRAGQQWWSGIFAWLLAYQVALVINGSVDVFLEGPAGGIWFWTVIGAGIAVLEAARRDRMDTFLRQLTPSTVQ